MPKTPSSIVTALSSPALVELSKPQAQEQKPKRKKKVAKEPEEIGGCSCGAKFTSHEQIAEHEEHCPLNPTPAETAKQENGTIRWKQPVKEQQPTSMWTIWETVCGQYRIVYTEPKHGDESPKYVPMRLRIVSSKYVTSARIWDSIRQNKDNGCMAYRSLDDAMYQVSEHHLAQWGVVPSHVNQPAPIKRAPAPVPVTTATPSASTPTPQQPAAQSREAKPVRLSAGETPETAGDNNQIVREALCAEWMSQRDICKKTGLNDRQVRYDYLYKLVACGFAEKQGGKYRRKGA